MGNQTELTMQIFSYFSEADECYHMSGSVTWDFTAVASKIFLRIFSGKPAWKMFTDFQKQNDFKILTLRMFLVLFNYLCLVSTLLCYQRNSIICFFYDIKDWLKLVVCTWSKPVGSKLMVITTYWQFNLVCLNLSKHITLLNRSLF
jgi:hypothetical protein